MRITKRDVVLISLSAMVGFALAAVGANVLVGLIAGAPSGALGGVIACIILRRLANRRRKEA